MLGQRCSRLPSKQAGGRRIRLGGFTLIEVLVAVAILAILAVAAAPSMTRIIARYRLTTAADELLTLMRYGQSEAKMRGGTGVTLSISNDELIVKHVVDEKNSAALRQMSLSSRLLLTRSDSIANDGITFLPNGQIRPSNNVSGRLDDSSRGILLLCSPNLPFNADPEKPPHNAIAIHFSGAELRRKEYGAGPACNTLPTP